MFSHGLGRLRRLTLLPRWSAPFNSSEATDCREQAVRLEEKAFYTSTLGGCQWTGYNENSRLRGTPKGDSGEFLWKPMHLDIRNCGTMSDNNNSTPVEIEGAQGASPSLEDRIEQLEWENAQLKRDRS